MRPFQELGPVPYHQRLRDAFKHGGLCTDWAERYPMIFDELDIGPAVNQRALGYHFHEWLAAIVLYHTMGYLSLVESYQFKKHKRKQEVFKSLASKPVLDLVIGRTLDEGPQCPDLVVYSEDMTDWFFCDAKGPGDVLSEAQQEFFSELARVSERPVRILHLEQLE